MFIGIKILTKKKIFLCVLLASAIFLFACGRPISAPELPPIYPPEVSLSESESAGQIFLADPIMSTGLLGIYDLESLDWTSIDEQDAFCQSFGWGNFPYIVFGKSKRLYHAGKIEESSLRFYYTLDDAKLSLTPFATDGELFLYIIADSYIDDTEDEFLKRIANNDWYRRVGTISEDGEFELFANLDGIGVDSGAIAGDYLYFTSYNFTSDLYEVWSVDLTLNDPQQEPVLIRDDYTTFQLYQYQGQVLYLDFEQQILYNDEVTIRFNRDTSTIMIDNEADMLAMKVQVPGEANELVLMNIPSGEVLGTYRKAINYVREGTDITIYGYGFIEHLSLAEEE